MENGALLVAFSFGGCVFAESYAGQSTQNEVRRVQHYELRMGRHTLVKTTIRNYYALARQLTAHV